MILSYPSDDCHTEAVEKFVLSTFHEVKNNETVVDLVRKELYGTNQTRFGAMPCFDSQVEVGRVISCWVNKGLPIPVIIPWGSEKPNGTGIDIAELCAFKTLETLNHRVKEIYPAGLEIRIKVEDVSAPHLFYDRMEQARNEAVLYTNGFVSLHRVMNLPFIKIILESSLVNEGTYNKFADSILPAMEGYLRGDEDELQILAEYGWQGKIEQETIDFYLGQYIKLYPAKSTSEHIHILARYFTGGLVRRNLGLYGINPDWNNDFLEISFHGVTPGLPKNRASRRIHLRTVPCSLSKQHHAPWRSKGYLLITNNSLAIPKLCCFNDQPADMHTLNIHFGNDDEAVLIHSDYIIE